MFRTEAMSRAVVFAFVALGAAQLCHGADMCCSSCIQCPNAGKCIDRTMLCDGVEQCGSGEDEDDAWCQAYSASSCPVHQARNTYGSCDLWYTVCNQWRPGSSSQYNNEVNTICPALRDKKLPDHLTPPPPPVHQTINMTELASYVSVTNCSAGGTRKERDCPMLYTAVAGVCLSFLPFAVTWPEAGELCRSISGQLVEFESVQDFSDIVQHLIKNDFSANYWTGGYFDIKTENWIWSTGFAMPHSTPYWALRYTKYCQTRSTLSLGDHTSCYNYMQAPANEVGQCAALQFEHMYYISDQGCFDKKRPICTINLPFLSVNSTVVH